MEANDTERLLMMSEAWHDQTGVAREGHIQIDGLIDWKAAVEEYYAEDPDVEVIEGTEFLKRFRNK